MKDNVTLRRYEFKYILPFEISNRIEEEIKNFMILDNFALANSDKSYFVRSIYFEDQFNSNFIEKVDGYMIRKKYRFRTYSNLKDRSPIFLEIKGRNLERTYKKRVEISKKYLELFNNNRNYMKLINIFSNNEIINDFVFNVFKKGLKPKIRIDYYRKPYISTHGLYFRLTFDNHLAASKIDDLNFINNDASQTLCKAGYTILEVKFERSIPAWFHRIIQSYNLRRRSISKYVLGICYCKMGFETSD